MTRLRVTALLLVIVVVFLLQCSSQSPQVVVMAIFHFNEHDFETNPQNFDRVKNKLLDFKPEVICVQWLPPSEQLDYYHSGYAFRINQLAAAQGLNQDSAELLVEQLFSEVLINPDDLVLRAKLANAFYLSKDFVNACYQWYIAQEEVKWLADDGISAAVSEVLPSPLGMYTSPLQEHEISEFIFPIARELELEQLYSVDDLSDNQAFQQTMHELQAELEEQGRGEQLREIIRKGRGRVELWRKTQYFLDSLNSASSRAMTRQTLEQIATISDSDPSQRFVSLWQQRGQKMVELTRQVIEQNPSKRVLIAIGSEHVPLFLELLGEFEDLKISTYDQL